MLAQHIQHDDPSMLAVSTDSWNEQFPAAFKQPLSEESDKANAITKPLGCFIVKDMQPYAVVENSGFVLELRYSNPSRQYFNHTVIPELLRDTTYEFKANGSKTFYAK